jgi:hypothetical protein
MDAALSGGDFARAANGKPYLLSGNAEMFQRAAIRLTVPAGAFCYDPTLGSRLSSLTGKEPDPDAAALLLAEEAVRALPGVEVLSAEYLAGAQPSVKILLGCGSEQKEIEVKL